MTIAEMVAKLQLMIDAKPAIANAAVYADGCDCYGAAVDVIDLAHWGDHGVVLISRTMAGTTVPP